MLKTTVEVYYTSEQDETVMAEVRALANRLAQFDVIILHEQVTTEKADATPPST